MPLQLQVYYVQHFLIENLQKNTTTIFFVAIWNNKISTHFICCNIRKKIINSYKRNKENGLASKLITQKTKKFLLGSKQNISKHKETEELGQDDLLPKETTRNKNKIKKFVEVQSLFQATTIYMLVPLSLNSSIKRPSQ